MINGTAAIHMARNHYCNHNFDRAKRVLLGAQRNSIHHTEQEKAKIANMIKSCQVKIAAQGRIDVYV